MSCVEVVPNFSYNTGGPRPSGFQFFLHSASSRLKHIFHPNHLSLSRRVSLRGPTLAITVRTRLSSITGFKQLSGGSLRIAYLKILQGPRYLVLQLRAIDNWKPGTEAHFGDDLT